MYQVTGGVRVMPVSTAQGFTAGASVSVPGQVPLPGCCDIASPSRVLVLNPVKSQFMATVVVNWPELVRSPRRP